MEIDKVKIKVFILIGIFLSGIFLFGADDAPKRKLLIVGFSVIGEAIEKEIVPAFVKKWKNEHNGEQIEFQYSWGASTAQARNVIAGLEADVVFLSLWPDVDLIQKAGLITHEWNADKKGIVSKSVVVFRVLENNPLQIKDWSDLVKDGVKVLTPNPLTSGGARWNILALYGAILKHGQTSEEAEQILRALYRNVVTFAENARASIQDFERGMADVVITYENEVLFLKKQGKSVEYVIPPSTIYIENPAAVVDLYADKHGTKDVALAFIDYLKSVESQKIFSEWGFRSILDDILNEKRQQYPVLPEAFDIEYIGGWPKVQEDFFGTQGLWAKIVQTERGARGH